MFENSIAANKQEIMNRIAGFYRQKYGIPEHREAPAEAKQTQAEYDAYSAGVYRAQQQANADLIAELGKVFAKR